MMSQFMCHFKNEKTNIDIKKLPFSTPLKKKILSPKPKNQQIHSHRSILCSTQNTGAGAFI
jgi:hypothetical protein